MTTRRNKYPLALLCLVMASCSSSKVQEQMAFADDRAAAIHFLQSNFTILDCSDRGIVSKGEVDDHFYDLFYSIDRNRSLHITYDELERAFSDSTDAQVSYLFRLMDGDLDSSVTTQEFRRFMFTAIDLADTNKNGEVTLADVNLEPPKIIRADQR